MFKPKDELNNVYKCTVRLLDDDDVIECDIQSTHRGKYLITYICERLEINEKDYFGLRYVDKAKQRQWLDESKFIIKQCKDIQPLVFSLRIKFYPADPFRLFGVARLMLYMQLKRDLKYGRLYCSINEAAALAALIVQEELGDYNEEIHCNNYISGMHLILRQTESIEQKIISLHKERKPFQNPTAAIEDFMTIAKKLEGYGIEPYPVKDHRGSQLYIGAHYSGVSTFLLGKRLQHFRWNEVQKLNYEGRMFIIHLSYTDSCREVRKHTIGFKCPNVTACRYLWRYTIEQMLFFTLPDSHSAHIVSGGGFLSWGSKFKYSGRTEREIITDSINSLREKRNILKKRKANSVPTSPSSPNGDVMKIRYSSLPRATLSEPFNRKSTTEPYRGSPKICHENNILKPVTEESFANIHFPSLRQSQLNRIIQCTNDSPDYFSIAPDSDCRMCKNKSSSGYADSKFNPCWGKHSLPCTKKTMHITVDSVTASRSFKSFIDTKRKFNLLNAFILSVLFSLLFLIICFVWIMESENQFSAHLRDMPEIVTLNYYYYNLLKKLILNCP